MGSLGHKLNVLLLAACAVGVCSAGLCLPKSVAAPPEPSSPSAVADDGNDVPISLAFTVEPGVVLARRPIVAVATLTAKRDTTVCLMRDPNVQFDIKVFDSNGKDVPHKPLVATLADGVYVSPFRPEGVFHRLAKLHAGDDMQLRLNLSRHMAWKRLPVGEYRVSATFKLCQQDIFKKLPVERQNILSEYPVPSMAVAAPQRARFYQSD